MSAVKARLDAFWTRTPIFYPNEGAEPPQDGNPFLAVQYPIAGEHTASMGAPGANVQRETGTIRFVLQIRSGADVIAFAAWLDELRAHFRHEDFGPVRTFSASPAVADDRNRNGSYFALSAAVEFEADFLG
ncbi:MAG: hypothetical protein DI607_07525 [Sphingomonas hengshuiensis]|nr:MAG: hypothetical protein DI607_07525 [Sphingomonas hengshuiensis]